MDIAELQLVSLIPARGGSERIQRKNIRMIAGKPMLAWTIEASLRAKHIQRTFVITEDEEIRKIALQYGAEVIITPEKYQTDDKYSLLGIFQMFKEYLWDINYIPDYVAFLYPTSPLRTSRQIDEAYELMLSRNCTRVYTAYKVDEGAYEELYTLNQDGTAKKNKRLTQEEIHKRHLGLQWKEPQYRHSNDVLIMRFRDALPYTDIYYDDLTLYIIDQKDVIDVNNEWDFEMAETLLKRRENG